MPQPHQILLAKLKHELFSPESDTIFSFRLLHELSKFKHLLYRETSFCFVLSSKKLFLMVSSIFLEVLALSVLFHSVPRFNNRSGIQWHFPPFMEHSQKSEIQARTIKSEASGTIRDIIARNPHHQKEKKKRKKKSRKITPPIPRAHPNRIFNRKKGRRPHSLVLPPLLALVASRTPHSPTTDDGPKPIKQAPTPSPS